MNKTFKTILSCTFIFLSILTILCGISFVLLNEDLFFENKTCKVEVDQFMDSVKSGDKSSAQKNLDKSLLYEKIDYISSKSENQLDIFFDKISGFESSNKPKITSNTWLETIGEYNIEVQKDLKSYFVKIKSYQESTNPCVIFSISAIEQKN